MSPFATANLTTSTQADGSLAFRVICLLVAHIIFTYLTVYLFFQQMAVVVMDNTEVSALSGPQRPDRHHLDRRVHRQHPGSPRGPL